MYLYKVSALLLTGIFVSTLAANADYDYKQNRYVPGFKSKRVTKSSSGKGTIGGSWTVEKIKQMERDKNKYAIVRDTNYYVRKNAAKRKAKQQANYKIWLGKQLSLYSKYVREKKYNEARSVAQALAKRNIVFGQRALGDLYLNGQGVKQDYKTAYQWYSAAATAGKDRVSQSMIGCMYLNGWHVKKDLAKAKDYFEKGDTREAQYYLGCMYRDGVGVEKNPELAFNFFKKADFKNLAKGSAALGEAYLLGQGVEKDAGKARSYLEKAARAGDPKAEFYLGEIYEKGLGVEKDAATAKTHFDRFEKLASKAKSQTLSYGLGDEFARLSKRRVNKES